MKHQRFVGTGYFGQVQNVITSGTASTTALAGSTETEQFHELPPTVYEAPTLSARLSDAPRRNFFGQRSGSGRFV